MATSLAGWNRPESPPREFRRGSFNWRGEAPDPWPTDQVMADLDEKRPAGCTRGRRGRWPK